MTGAIINRYVGTVLQFLILAYLSRTLTSEDYGLYVFCIGIIYSFYYVVGFGTSESAVYELASNPSQAPHESESIISCILYSVLFSGLLLLAIYWGMSTLDLIRGNTSNASAFITVMLILNGALFNVSQVLVGLNKPQIGSFFFYPAINIGATIAIAAVAFSNYTLNVESNKIQVIFTAVVISSSVILACAVVIAGRIKRIRILPTNIKKTLQLARNGMLLLMSRILHVFSFWIPTTVAGLVIGTEESGVIGTAGRIAIAVAAAIAAVRFVVRPRLLSFCERGEYEQIASLSRTLAFSMTSLALAAFFANLVLGETLLPLIFGPNLAGVHELLVILLLGVVAEAFFGPVDEILKALGEYNLTSLVYFTYTTLFLGLCIFFASYGLKALAFLQLIFVFCLFTSFNFLSYRRIGYFIFPFPRIRNARPHKD